MHKLGFQEESFHAVVEEIVPLLRDHYDELTLHKDVVQLDPDWRLYEALHRDQMLRIYTARDDDVLVGYAIFFVNYHPHYRQLLRAVNDVLFLAKDYRHGSTGLRLVAFADQALVDLGVQRIHWHLKIATHGMEHVGIHKPLGADRDLVPIFKRMGYEVEETVVGRVVKGN